MWSNGDLIAREMTDACLADAAIVADHFVTVHRQGNGLLLAAGIQHDVDVFPAVTTGMVFQAEGNKSPLLSSPLREAFCLTGLPPKGG